MYEPRTSPIRTRFQDWGQITRIQPVGVSNQLLHYLSRLEVATLGNSMVKSLFVQIGVWNFQWLTTVSATGEQNRSVLLTLAMPRGGLFQMHRFHKDSLKSLSRSDREIKLVLLPPDHRLVHKYGGTWEVIVEKRPWWSFLTRGW